MLVLDGLLQEITLIAYTADMNSNTTYFAYLLVVCSIKNAYGVLTGKPEGKIPLGRPRRKWEDNTKMDLTEIVWGGMDWIHLAEDSDQWRALVNRVMNLRTP
jgi:hypothetical protein